LVAVKDGRIFAAGSPKLVMTEDTIQEVFDLECRVVADPVLGTPMCILIGHKGKGNKS
ncbi:MAG: cobalamin/Fe(3+)-siderophore ABC transporter ATP-binding protein, partial [Chroococcidiopsis sp.]